MNLRHHIFAAGFCLLLVRSALCTNIVDAFQALPWALSKMDKSSDRQVVLENFRKNGFIGFCWIGEDKNSPCVKIQFILLDDAGQEVTHFSTDTDGAFGVVLPDGRRYELKLNSSLYKLNDGKTVFVRKGDQIDLIVQSRVSVK